jgi:hypothetical protein
MNCIISCCPRLTCYDGNFMNKAQKSKQCIHCGNRATKGRDICSQCKCGCQSCGKRFPGGEGQKQCRQCYMKDHAVTLDDMVIPCPDCGDKRLIRDRRTRSNIRCGRNTARCRKCRTIAWLSKMEIKDKVYNTINPRGTKFIQEMLNDWQYDWKFQCGDNEFRWSNYYADAYCKEHNVWFEYDEPCHYDKDGKLRPKDELRMLKIILGLKCSFWRYNEATQELVRYN